MKSYEMINGRGKRRVICSLNAVDRFVARLLAQKLRRYMEPEFCENSFAYQEGKGVAAAVEKACQYINEGYTIVAEMDIESYFDKIPLDRMMLLIEQKIEDKAVRQLIRRFLYCKVAFDSRIEDKTIGIIQVNPASPVLSNFYLKLISLFGNTTWVEREIRYAINEIYARKGYDFTGTGYERYFAEKDWYHPIGGKQVTEEELNSYEKANIDLLVKIEKEVQAAMPDEA